MNEPKDGKRWSTCIGGYVSAPLVEAFMGDLMAVCAKHKMTIYDDSQSGMVICAESEWETGELRHAHIGDISLVPLSEHPVKAAEYVDVVTFRTDGPALYERVKK